MLLRVDHGTSQPLHDQVAGQIRAAVASGELEPGERLPPARELATGLGVNVHTVLRSLAALRDEGLLDMRRGRGTTVTNTAPRLAAVAEMIQQLVSEARHQGLSDPQIRGLVEAAL